MNQHQKFDTLIVDQKSAVFFQPDSNQIKKRISEIGEEAFVTGADDFANYMQTSHDFLYGAKLKILDAKNSTFIEFIGADRATTIIRLDTLPTLWGVFLYDPITKPQLIDITTVSEEYKAYFK